MLVFGELKEPPIWTMDDNVFLVPQCGITIVVNGSMRNHLTGFLLSFANKKDAAGDHNRFPWFDDLNTSCSVHDGGDEDNDDDHCN